MKTMLLAGDIQYLIWKYNKQLKMMKKGLNINGRKERESANWARAGQSWARWSGALAGKASQLILRHCLTYPPLMVRNKFYSLNLTLFVKVLPKERFFHKDLSESQDKFFPPPSFSSRT